MSTTGRVKKQKLISVIHSARGDAIGIHDSIHLLALQKIHSKNCRINGIVFADRIKRFHLSFLLLAYFLTKNYPLLNQVGVRYLG